MLIQTYALSKNDISSSMIMKTMYCLIYLPFKLQLALGEWNGSEFVLIAIFFLLKSLIR